MLTLKDIKLCFQNLVGKMHDESRFYCTFFEKNSKHHNPKHDSDPNECWVYTWETMSETASSVGLELEYIGDWNHPRKQKHARSIGKSLGQSGKARAKTGPKHQQEHRGRKKQKTHVNIHSQESQEKRPEAPNQKG